jgi:hypothetical protein
MPTESKDFDTAIAAFLDQAQAMVDAYMTNRYPHHSYPNIARAVLSTIPGKRYVRVVSSDGSVYCFIDTTNGDVLKAATRKAPAKGPRGNIFADNPIAGLTPYGAARAR